jgi:hypothetical protein
VPYRLDGTPVWRTEDVDRWAERNDVASR